MKSVWVIGNVSACVLTVLVMIWRPHDGQTTEIALAALIPDESASAAENDCPALIGSATLALRHRRDGNHRKSW
jgi:hypothetical protein